MSLEDAMSQLAVAMNRYSDVIEKYGVAVEAKNSGGDASEKPAARGKPGPKPKPSAAAEPPDDEDDGLGGEDEGLGEDELTIDDVKAKLVEVRTKTGDKEAALAIMKKYGYAKVGDIKEKDFAAIVKACEKHLK